MGVAFILVHSHILPWNAEAKVNESNPTMMLLIYIFWVLCRIGTCCEILSQNNSFLKGA